MLREIWRNLHKWGTPNSWMVYFMENLIEIDDFEIFEGPPISGNLHMLYGYCGRFIAGILRQWGRIVVSSLAVLIKVLRK